jgi:hypothetical protein
MKLSISEILSLAGKAKTTKEKVSVLLANQSEPLRTILRLTYDPKVEWLVPTSTPPYKPSESFEAQGMLYSQTRRLKIFHKGGGYDTLNQIRREVLFVELLESVDKDDALVLVDMLTNSKFKGLTEKTVKEAFPELF